MDAGTGRGIWELPHIAHVGLHHMRLSLTPGHLPPLNDLLHFILGHDSRIQTLTVAASESALEVIRWVVPAGDHRVVLQDTATLTGGGDGLVMREWEARVACPDHRLWKRNSPV
ncbi:hypothetical protein BOTBODRAFT_26559 [Botryobasidium botryosum FD-172 SS1]|uniref:Uncharacterized protein n=1 Tax=Botryobasidium botryosum (strain FD-172 SS1) TaxID=930990 RepID=A0A067N8T6_BOTB1|nr:hypothetical protein BOTBODRAFT_26559 [Botryobasidium botryosum FD-172 SS1]